MKRNSALKLYVIVGSVLMFLWCVNARADSFSYVTTSAGQFGTVDLNNGDVSIISPLPSTPAGIATGANGLLYAAETGLEGAPNELITINSANGTTTPVGPIGVTLTAFAGLTNGALFGLDSSNNLYSLNPLTGAATLVGSTGIQPYNDSFGFTDGLAGSATTLFFTLQLGTPNPTLAPSLFSIDPTTGASTLVGQTGVTDIAGLGFDQNTLYGFTSPFFSGTTVPSIYTIDTSTAAATFDAQLNPNNGIGFFGATPAPEPSALLLLGTGLLGLMGIGLYKKRLA